MKKGKMRVRFAPSPTGYLHIGSARTALFNFLFVRNQKGTFILRIEDTDIKRSSLEMAEQIINGLKWLNITWDEGPYFQSYHFEKYKKTAFDLLKKKKVYRCFCTPDEIEVNRKKNLTWKYDRKCLNLTEKQIEKKLEQKVPFVLRFFVPEGFTSFNDGIHKKMRVNNSEIEDFVILKSDFTPTYHLSVVVDDNEMGITDVIRGDDHISNTFKQILLLNALSFNVPEYFHLPLIFGEDKKKLSKRHGEISVLEFKKRGYLPETLITYLSQLSWLPGDEKKIFSLDELIKRFKFNKLAKNSPVFDYNKLSFLNALAIKKKDSGEIYNILIEDKKFEKDFSEFTYDKKISFIELIKSRMKNLNEMKGKAYIYLKRDIKYNKDDLKNLKFHKNIEDLLEKFINKLESLEVFNSENIEKVLRLCADNNEIKAADLIHPCRFALVASNISPSIFDLFEFLGKEESIERIKNFIDYIIKEK